MPILTANSGPLQGRTFSNLWEWMDAKQALQNSCPHQNRHLISGVCGQGLRKQTWSRTVCPDCNAVLSGNTMTNIPDYEEQKELEADFWRRYRMAKEGETPYWHCLMGSHPQVGDVVRFCTSIPDRQLAVRWIKQELKLSKLPTDGRVVAVVAV